MSHSTSHAQPAGRRGFTIIELVIGVAIVAVLSVVAVPQYVSYVRRAEVKHAVADIRMLETLIGRYHTEMGAPPDDLGGAVDPVPDDPWGRISWSIRGCNRRSSPPWTPDPPIGSWSWARVRGP